MKFIKALLISLIASSAFAAGGTHVIQGDKVILSSVTVSGLAGTGAQCVQIDNSGTLQSAGIGQCGSGGGGGSSSLATGLGTTSGYTTFLSSPTPGVIFNNAQFTGSLNSGNTAYYQLSASSVTLQGPITAASLGALTANQNITLSGDSTGSGTTAITATAAAQQSHIVTLSASSVTVTGAAGLLVIGTTTINGNINISSGVLLSGTAGTNGQLLTSGGVGAVPTWTTVSGGSGGGIVSPASFTWTNAYGISMSTAQVGTGTFIPVDSTNPALKVIGSSTTNNAPAVVAIFVSTTTGGNPTTGFGVETDYYSQFASTAALKIGSIGFTPDYSGLGVGAGSSFIINMVGNTYDLPTSLTHYYQAFKIKQENGVSSFGLGLSPVLADGGNPYTGMTLDVGGSYQGSNVVNYPIFADGISGGLMSAGFGGGIYLGATDLYHANVLGAIGSQSTTWGASPTADMVFSNVQNNILYEEARLTSNGTFKVEGSTNPSITVTEGIVLSSMTITQLRSATPSAVGEIWYCSNCGTSSIAVATGTASGQWGAGESRTTFPH